MNADAQSALRRLEATWKHIEEVRRNAYVLAERLIEQGEIELGVSLARNVLTHDQSKLTGVEWDNLGRGEDATDHYKLQLAVHHHNRTNPHHPEYWNGISNMRQVYLAEMVCDWKTRANEFGTSLQEWIDNDAAARFGYKTKDRVHRDIRRFAKLLLEQPFKKI